jgi:hypothetical protein
LKKTVADQGLGLWIVPKPQRIGRCSLSLGAFSASEGHMTGCFSLWIAVLAGFVSCSCGMVTKSGFLQDMTTLSHLNEPGVLWNLKCRYMLDAIYTYTGSILIAVNPFGPLPHMYGAHMMEQYRGATLGELSPHVYAIADSAYRQMRKETRSQSILVRDIT